MIKLIQNLRRHGERPCNGVIDWAGSLPAETSIPEAVDLCDRGDWLLWAAEALGLEIPEAAYRPTVLRALREQAPTKLEAAGLADHAERLRALPDDCCWSSAAAAAMAAAAAAADAAWSATADAAVGAIYADAAKAAASVMYAVADATRYAAAKAADAAWYAAASGADEWARCADEVRAVLRDDLVRALEDK